MVQVHCVEGVATHIGPEPCVSARKGSGEASAGERTGQPLRREPTPSMRRKATRRGAPARAPRRPSAVGDPSICGRSLRVWTLLAREPRDLRPSRRLRSSGPHREGEGPKPIMQGAETSDSSIVAPKPTNTAGMPAAKPVESREEAKGNTLQQWALDLIPFTRSTSNPRFADVSRRLSSDSCLCAAPPRGLSYVSLCCRQNSPADHQPDHFVLRGLPDLTLSCEPATA